MVYIKFYFGQTGPIWYNGRFPYIYRLRKFHKQNVPLVVTLVHQHKTISKLLSTTKQVFRNNNNSDHFFEPIIEKQLQQIYNNSLD